MKLRRNLASSTVPEDGRERAENDDFELRGLESEPVSTRIAALRELVPITVISIDEFLDDSTTARQLFQIVFFLCREFC